uniref:MLO-like protein n=1 Tax=Brassica campestris TaxID=3711 RepID=M4ERK0_BRACM
MADKVADKVAEKVAERTLQQTSTWAVAVVCFFLLLISIVIEKLIHKLGNWFKRKNKKALYEALEKVKAELMLMGFISLLLTIGQNYISQICVSESVAASMRPCSRSEEEKKYPNTKKDTGKDLGDEENSGRKLLELVESFIPRRSLATKGYDKCAEKGQVAFVSSYGMHQLHIFIFVLAVCHVIYCILTYALGKTKAHLAPGSDARFDFRKYIQRSLEEDFKTIVEISPVIWFVAVLFLLTNTNVGTKLQVIITKLGLLIQEKGDIVKGMPLVQPGDHLFWFGRPRFILFLVHLVLFTNAFQLAFFAWTTYEFKLKNCFHKNTVDVVIRISVGVIVQVLCSYVTLPLYALVTQMGSKMKPTVFNERVAVALKSWHHTAKKQMKHGRTSESTTPFSSRPATPTHGSSPIHLLHNVHKRSRSADESFANSMSPRRNSDFDTWDVESQQEPSSSSVKYHSRFREENSEKKKPASSSAVELPPGTGQARTHQHEISSISLRDFSFK